MIAENDSVSVEGETNDPALLKAISKMKKLDIKLADVTKVIVDFSWTLN